jgi:hypothetical protein
VCTKPGDPAMNDPDHRRAEQLTAEHRASSAAPG